MKKVIICSLILIGFGKASFSGEDITGQLGLINKAYTECKQFSANLEISVYGSWDSSQAYISYNGAIYCSGTTYYQKMREFEKISTPDKQILVNNDKKQMLIIPPVYSEGKTLTGQKETLEFITNNLKLFSTVKTSKFKRKYQKLEFVFANKSFPYAKIELIYSPDDYGIRKIILYSTQGYQDEVNGISTSTSRVELSYTNVIFNSKSDNNKKGLQNFISLNQKEIKPVGKYSNYQIINRLNQ